VLAETADRTALIVTVDGVTYTAHRTDQAPPTIDSGTETAATSLATSAATSVPTTWWNRGGPFVSNQNEPTGCETPMRISMCSARRRSV